MGKRLDSMLFPGGKAKCLTFSYDDGVVQDRRLVRLFNDHGVKGTFNLGSGVLSFRGSMVLNGHETDISKVEPEEVRSLYAGHEVAGHGLYHSALQSVGTPAAMYEIIEDRRRLEKLVGKQVRMFAYPFGTYNGHVTELLRLAGYTGARTVVSTRRFDIPENFLEWHPTCHHSDPELMKLAERFCMDKPVFAPMLFYVWGHAYEFDADGSWEVMEKLCGYVARFADDIWFATNTEIVDYVTACRGLIYSADGHLVTNPYAVKIWLRAGGEEYCIAAGETVEITDSGL